MTTRVTATTATAAAAAAATTTIMERRMITSFASCRGRKQLSANTSFLWNRPTVQPLSLPGPYTSLLPSSLPSELHLTGAKPFATDSQVQGRFASSASPASAATTNDLLDDDDDDDDANKCEKDEKRDSFNDHKSMEKQEPSQESSMWKKEERQPLSADKYNPISLLGDIRHAASLNLSPLTMDNLHKEDIGDEEETSKNINGTERDRARVSTVVEDYQQHLQFIHQALQQQQQRQKEQKSREKRGLFLDLALQHAGVSSTEQAAATYELLSSDVTAKALVASTQMDISPYSLSVKVRALERLIGQIGMTPLTDRLSFSLLQANGQAGNVGRSLALLNLRKTRQYPPQMREFEHAIQSLRSAALYLRNHRNVFMGDFEQPHIDDPTRWLDAILINMSSRGAQLNHYLAGRMLNCYASTGRTGKAVHFFYHLYERESALDDGDEEKEEKEAVEGNENVAEGEEEHAPSVPRLSMRDLPPFEKIPSQVKGKLIFSRRSRKHITKLARESERDWSIPLTAAFAFAESLSQGACGHEPLAFDVTMWNIMIKVCCYRGALWRALWILQHVMPRKAIEPDSISYNTIITGLSRVGDCETSMELFQTMQEKQVPICKVTVHVMVCGMLNVGDVAGAIRFVETVFVQYTVIPPYFTHLKILELALGQDLVYEAKRYVRVLEQMRQWRPHDHPETDPRLARRIRALQTSHKLSREALGELFAHFGYELTPKDFES